MIKKAILALSVAAVFTACSKDDDPVIPVVPPSGGSTITLNGGAGGSSAANSVYVDFSTDKQDSIKRVSWDLGFYSGNDFRVILNNTTAATAKVTTKTDINTVGIADTVGLNKLALAFSVADFAMVDDISGDISKTAIPEISATEANNRVIIINRGTGGGIAARDWYKVRILRNGSGYTLQYAKLDATTFSTLNITKDNNYNFKYTSLESGAATVEPPKAEWDIVWTYGMSTTYYSFVGADIPYGFSDLVFTNQRGGTTAFERVYADATIASAAYTNFNKDSVTKYTFAGSKWTIGSNWRLTVASSGEPAGIRKSRFYVVKDAAGNVYKLKFSAAGLASDGGTRGKPEIAYELIK